MSQEVVVTFTFKGIETLLANGGTSSWRLDPGRARRCAYAVCTRNAKDPRVEGPEPDYAAFLVGKISDVVPAPDDPGDYLVRFSAYALVSRADVWRKGDRNPVRYAQLDELGIDWSALAWQPMPPRVAKAEHSHDEEAIVFAPAPPGVGPLTMADAKKGLALTFGVPPEAIEITIRG